MGWFELSAQRLAGGLGWFEFVGSAAPEATTLVQVQAYQTVPGASRNSAALRVERQLRCQNYGPH